VDDDFATGDGTRGIETLGIDLGAKIRGRGVAKVEGEVIGKSKGEEARGVALRWEAAKEPNVVVAVCGGTHAIQCE